METRRVSSQSQADHPLHPVGSCCRDSERIASYFKVCPGYGCVWKWGIQVEHHGKSSFIWWIWGTLFSDNPCHFHATNRVKPACPRFALLLLPCDNSWDSRCILGWTPEHNGTCWFVVLYALQYQNKTILWFSIVSTGLQKLQWPAKIHMHHCSDYSHVLASLYLETLQDRDTIYSKGLCHCQDLDITFAMSLAIGTFDSYVKAWSVAIAQMIHPLVVTSPPGCPTGRTTRLCFLQYQRCVLSIFSCLAIQIDGW